MPRHLRADAERAGACSTPALLGTLLAGALLVVACSSAPAGSSGSPRARTSQIAASGITVTSTAFTAGGRIPERFTCDGAGDAPPLAWTGVPPAARSIAILVQDPDAPGGTYTHWVVGGVPATASSLAGEALPDGAVQAVTSAGRPGYSPPCPPSGTHHYRFTVSALDTADPFADGAPIGRALASIDAHVIASGTLVGLYSRG